MTTTNLCSYFTLAVIASSLLFIVLIIVESLRRRPVNFAAAPVPKGPERTRLPDERGQVSQRFCLHTDPADVIVCPKCEAKIEQPPGEIHLYVTANCDEAGNLREIFVHTQDRSGWVPSLEAMAISLSVALQYGVPAEVILSKWRDMHGSPAGVIRAPWLTAGRCRVKSLQDLLARWLLWRFPGGKLPAQPPAKHEPNE